MMTADTWTWLPRMLEARGPGLQAVLLGLSTFIQEDIPTVTAALLAGAGHLTWPVALFGCFFGIWVGDALLYLAARIFGRRLLALPWARRWVNADAVSRSENWFARRGTWILVTSRFVPGTRLPTYLAAGFLRLSFTRFLLVTGIVVAVWTTLIFSAAHLVGARVGEGLKHWNAGVWVFVPAIGLVLAGVRGTQRLAGGHPFRTLRTTLGRWRRWEFWPAWLFYLPVAANYLRLAIRYRGWTVPTAANPGIATGGMIGESKIATLRDLSMACPDFTAEAWALPAGRGPDRLQRLAEILGEHRVPYPFVLKPDVGQRGVGVKVIRQWTDAEAYLGRTTAALVVQRYVPGPFEAGVFYYRFPHESRGRIFAITEKIFPKVTGDGRHTLEELIWRDDRARWTAARYLRRVQASRHRVPAVGEQVALVLTGNHAQGCQFLDGARWCTPELEDRIDAIARSVPGFFIGRFDLRFESEEAFRRGQGFQILELNGASAEATHIYDARYSLGFAYRTLFQQWELVFAIGAAHRDRGVQPTTPLALWRLWRQARHDAANYPDSD